MGEAGSLARSALWLAVGPQRSGRGSPPGEGVLGGGPAFLLISIEECPVSVGALPSPGRNVLGCDPRLLCGVFFQTLDHTRSSTAGNAA